MRILMRSFLKEPPVRTRYAVERFQLLSVATATHASVPFSFRLGIESAEKGIQVRLNGEAADAILKLLGLEAKIPEALGVETKNDLADAIAHG
jgi:hypothetical protein